MLYAGLWVQGSIIQQLMLVEVLRYWSGVALLLIPKVDPDNARSMGDAGNIKNKNGLEEIG